MHACPQRVEQAAEQKELEAAELVAQGIAVDPREKQQQLQPSRPAVAVTAGPFLIQSLVPELEGMDLGQGLAQAPQVQQQQAESVDLGQGLAQAQQQQQPPQQAEGVEVPGVGREQQGVGQEQQVQCLVWEQQAEGMEVAGQGQEQQQQLPHGREEDAPDSASAPLVPASTPLDPASGSSAPLDPASLPLDPASGSSAPLDPSSASLPLDPASGSSAPLDPSSASVDPTSAAPDPALSTALAARPASASLGGALPQPPTVAALCASSLTDEHLRAVLRRVWGFPDFRGRQLLLVRAVLAARPMLGILPTGAGESLGV